MSKLSAKEIRRLSEGLPPWESMSFACGGWLQFYMFGVAKALQIRGLDKDVTYCGCSAGALVSVGLILEGDFDDAIRFCKEEGIPRAYGAITGLFKLHEYVLKCIDDYLIQKYKDIPPNQLQIAVTKVWGFRGEIVKVHDSKSDLIDSLLASSAAFPFASIVKRNGSWYIDGGWTDFQPIVDEDTITVSPFYFSDCDIKPSRYVPIWWAFAPPPSKDTIDWLYNLGYHDCMNYINSRGIPPSPRCVHSPSPILSARDAHEYDEPRKISMHRFLGYDLKNMTNQYVAFVMDLALLVLFLLVWKPLAMLFIYAELFTRTTYLSILFLCSIIIQIGKRMIVKTSTTSSTLLVEEIKQMDKLWSQLLDCLSCLVSLSLFLRWFSGRPSSAALRKHDRLAKSSILYRVFRHII